MVYFNKLLKSIIHPLPLPLYAYCNLSHMLAFLDSSLIIISVLFNKFKYSQVWSMAVPTISDDDLRRFRPDFAFTPPTSLRHHASNATDLISTHRLTASINSKYSLHDWYKTKQRIDYKNISLHALPRIIGKYSWLSTILVC